MARNPFKSRPRSWRRFGAPRPWWKQFSFLVVALPLSAFAAVLVMPNGWPPAAGLELPGGGADDAESATFELCGRGARVDCVIDGDTFWYGGEKIRIADINTPEVSEPACAREAELGAAATERLQTLLNQGAFTLQLGSATATSTAGCCARLPATAQAWAH